MQDQIDPPPPKVMAMPDDKRDEIMERAAILEFDAGMRRDVAMATAIYYATGRRKRD